MRVARNKKLHDDLDIAVVFLETYSLRDEINIL